MPRLHAALPRDRFLPLPGHGSTGAADRRVGVEVEFAGLDVAEAARAIARSWGGAIHARDPRDIRLQGTALGDLRVELDIALKRQWVEDLAAQLLGDLIPVEVITDPLPQSDLPRVETLLRDLVAAGAVGSGAKLAYGFGVHFNVELPDDGGAALVATARAFALCEDWLRAADPLDPARRVLPFVAPFPPALVAHLAAHPDLAAPELARAMAAHAPSRNFGLDLLPALQQLCPEALAGVPDDHLKGARPVFHYRLPEARLDEDGWSLAYEWNRWAVIEHIAADAALLEALAEGWRAQHVDGRDASGDWPDRVEALLQQAGLPHLLLSQ